MPSGPCTPVIPCVPVVPCAPVVPWEPLLRESMLIVLVAGLAVILILLPGVKVKVVVTLAAKDVELAITLEKELVVVTPVSRAPLPRM